MATAVESVAANNRALYPASLWGGGRGGVTAACVQNNRLQRRIPDMVAVIYADVDKRLHPAACHSVLAHIIRLVELGRVGSEGPPRVDTEYWLKPAP